MVRFSALLIICAGNSPVSDEFPTQRPVTRSIGVFFQRICAWIIGWVNNDEAGYLRRHYTHYDVTIIINDTQGRLKPFWYNSLKSCEFILNFSRHAPTRRLGCFIGAPPGWNQYVLTGQSIVCLLQAIYHTSWVSTGIPRGTRNVLQWRHMSVIASHINDNLTVV